MPSLASATLRLSVGLLERGRGVAWPLWWISLSQVACGNGTRTLFFVQLWCSALCALTNVWVSIIAPTCE